LDEEARLEEIAKRLKTEDMGPLDAYELMTEYDKLSCIVYKRKYTDPYFAQVERKL